MKKLDCFVTGFGCFLKGLVSFGLGPLAILLAFEQESVWMTILGVVGGASIIIVGCICAYFLGRDLHRFEELKKIKIISDMCDLAIADYERPWNMYELEQKVAIELAKKDMQEKEDKS